MEPLACRQFLQYQGKLENDLNFGFLQPTIELSHYSLKFDYVLKKIQGALKL